MTDQAEEKIQKARTQLTLHQPFFSTLLMKFPLIYTDQVPTMGVDGRRLYVNKDFVNSLSVRDVKTVLCHEILHIIFQHPHRGVIYDAKKWNYATDYAINAFLKEVSDEVEEEVKKVDPTAIEGVLYDPKWHGYSADYIYKHLPEDGTDGKGGAGDKVIGNDIMESDGHMSEAEKAELETEIKIAVSQANTVAKMQGNTSAGLQRLVDNIVGAKINWKEVLQQLLTKNSKDDYCWQRPNKRYLSHNIVLPELYNEQMGEIAVGIDTSGSVSSEELTDFVSELNGIVSELVPEKTTVYYWDAELTQKEEFEPVDLPLQVNPKGGGGTDPKPMFNEIERDDVEYEAIVCLTDGYFDTGDIPSVDYPLLWIISSDGDKNFSPPYGEVYFL